MLMVNNEDMNDGSSELTDAQDLVRRLKKEIVFREKTMATNLLLIEHHNAFLLELLKQMQAIYANPRHLSVHEEIDKLVDLVQQQLKKVDNHHFERFFFLTHARFVESLNKEHPDLTALERRMCMLLFSGLTTKDISEVTMQSCRAVEMARHRIRKKLGLDRKDNISAYLVNLSQ